MSSRLLFSAVCLVLAALLQSCHPSAGFDLVRTDPMDKLCREEFCATENMARGETFSIQIRIDTSVPLTVKDIVLDDRLFDDIAVWRVGSVRTTFRYEPESDDRLPGELFPDILHYADFPQPVDSSATYFIEARISTDAPAGDHAPKLKIITDRGVKKLRLPLKIYPVTLDPQSLKVVNWIFDSFADEAIDRFSDRYFDEMAEIIRLASRYGQNVWKLPENLVRKTENGYDFSLFNRYFGLFYENAKEVRLVTGSHIGGRTGGGWADSFEAKVDDVEGYIKALYENLLSHNFPDGRCWADVYAQHVADEPIPSNLAGWETLARRVKAAAPLRIIEAYRSDTYDPSLIDIIVPQLDEICWPSYSAISSHPEKWFYTCMYPRWNYPNRYVELPLGKTRILHWVNFRYGFVGYLHWGLNYWDGIENPLEDVSNPQSGWPGGDAMLFYRLDGRTLPSLRAAAMRDGINDYTLLTMLDKKDPQAARALCAELVENEYTCNSSPFFIRKTRERILDLLSEIR